MMKKRLLVYIALLGGLAFSCRDLNLEPKGILGESELFGTEYGVKMYFAGIYDYLPIEDFTYYGTSGFRGDDNEYWQAGKYNQGNMSGEFFNTWTGVDNDGFAYWPYDRIRDVNTFIGNFPAYRDNYTDVEFNKLMGEARFLRAYFYFGLAKRYGGVPIIA